MVDITAAISIAPRQCPQDGAVLEDGVTEIDREDPAAKLLLWVDRNRRWLLTAMLAVYLLSFNGRWRIEPDSALYLTIARNLAQGQGYSYHGQLNRLAYPGLPVLLAGTFWIFGIGAMWPAHVLMLLFGAAVVWLTFRLIHIHAGRPTAVLVTCLVGFSYSCVRYSLELRNDMPFLTGAMAALCGFEGIFCRSRLEPRHEFETAKAKRRLKVDWLLLTGGLILAAAMRPTALAFLPIVMGGIVLRLRNSRPRSLVLTVLGCAGLLLLVFALDPRRAGGSLVLDSYEQDLYVRMTNHLGELLRTVATRNLPQIVRSAPAAMFGHELGPGLNVLATIALLGSGLYLARRRGIWGAWVLATVAMMLVSLPRDRYFLAVLPLLAYGWWLLCTAVSRRLPRPQRQWALAGLLLLWTGPNLGKIVGLIIEQRRSPFLAHYHQGHYLPIVQAAKELEKQVGPNDVVLCPAGMGRILSYLSDRRVMEVWQWQAEQDAGTSLPAFVLEPAEKEGDELPEFLRSHSLRLATRLLEVPRALQDRSRIPWTLYALEDLAKNRNRVNGLSAGEP
jgi:hypothetical protein